ncbi:MAG TPA: hypothetical protein VFU68_02205 [Terracidiphilus sp.]|nr:hypothetical protein [Terracidiphilus sp.]
MAIFDSDDSEDSKSEGNAVVEEPNEYEKQTGRIFVFVLLLHLPLIALPFFSEKPEFSIGIGISAVANVLAILKCGELWERIWFWILIALIEGANASLAVFAHWPRVMMTRLTLLPFGVAYFCLTVGIVTFFDKFVFKSNALGEE